MSFRSSSAIALSAERIQSFAAEFDPQPCHVDEAFARAGVFGGLIASGWHTAAVAMRLLVDSDGDLGLGGRGAGVEIESMKWLRPVRRGDSLRLEGSVIEARPSRSRADRGS